MTELRLADGFAFGDLYSLDGISRLDGLFSARLAEADSGLEDRLRAAREAPESITPLEYSELLLELSPHLEGFIARLFRIEDELKALSSRHKELEPLYRCKRLFVQRRAAKKFSPEEADALDGTALQAELESAFGEPLSEEVFARRVIAWLEDEEANAKPLEVALRFAAWALLSAEGRERFETGVLFKTPEKREPERLIPLERETKDGIETMGLPEKRRRRRDGFGLTDPGTDLKGALDQAHYCIFCHDRGKDSCSHGFKEKAGGFRTNDFAEPLVGCPLEEKISEMNSAKAAGQPIGALAIATVDNPMVAATGHHICNDCMKGCIFQKQDPVDIPQIETRVLKDVLALPWGFEIYSLLTRWNPLNIARPRPRPPTGRKILVAGLGPAGFTLAHHLLNDGHTVAAIDGSKIEPLPPEISGVGAEGQRQPFEPVRDVETLYESLDERVMAGFGGLSEYGITVRWNKNFLKIIRLLLERRESFAMFGGVRLGGAVTIESAFEMGFDHVALAVGGGHPTMASIPNGLARGVRSGSDFLMALQLTGAAKRDSVANMQIRLPVVVVGGGLTSIDTATEALAYYPFQVEKFLERHETLVAERGAGAVGAPWDEEERKIADEFLDHARAIRAEREKAAAEGREPRIRELLESWGGVTIAYRKRLIDSPMYRLNPEEVAFALQEGFRIVELLSPHSIELDGYGHVSGIRFTRQKRAKDGSGFEDLDEVEYLPARTVLMAIGTQPNTVLAREEPESIGLDGRFFQAVDGQGKPATPERISKPREPLVFASVRDDGRSVSFYGDAHPSYAGNVVKAMAGATHAYPLITRMLEGLEGSPATGDGDFLGRLDGELRCAVQEVKRLNAGAVELVVRAPLAARSFLPGQLFRLQNFEAHALRVAETTLAMEGLPLAGAWADPEKGLVGLIIMEGGGSSNLPALLKPGEPVVLMGPTGTPAEIPQGESVLLAGEGFGNAVLPAIGRAMREKGCRVLFFAGYGTEAERFKVEEIEAASDTTVWCCLEPPGITPERAEDSAFTGSLVEAIAAYGRDELGAQPIPLSEVDRVVAIGPAPMMAALAEARHGLLKTMLKTSHLALGGINSPMQCMMKEICAQCLQPQRDPATGEERLVFSCFDQNQPLDEVDFAALKERLRQNSVHEKLTRQWIERCLETLS